MSHDEAHSLPKKFPAELDELRDDISHSRKMLRIIEESLNESIRKIATITTEERRPKGVRPNCHGLIVSQIKIAEIGVLAGV